MSYNVFRTVTSHTFKFCPKIQGTPEYLLTEIGESVERCGKAIPSLTLCTFAFYSIWKKERALDYGQAMLWCFHWHHLQFFHRFCTTDNHGEGLWKHHQQLSDLLQWPSQPNPFSSHLSLPQLIYLIPTFFLISLQDFFFSQ